MSTAQQAADSLDILRDWSRVFTLTATRCCCCGLDLRDALSVTRGIGPECSKKHYDVDFEITDDMVAECLGHIVSSGLDYRFRTECVNLKEKPRDLSNLLVWWASVNLNVTDTVLACADAVSALGFTSLGDRLRERNTNVIITKCDDQGYILRCKSRRNVLENMSKVREAIKVPREGRFKAGWKFPAERKMLVWTILGEDFGGEWATVPPKNPEDPSVVTKVPQASHSEIMKLLRNTYNPPAPVTHTQQVVPATTQPTQGRAVRIVAPKVVGDPALVYTPYRNFDFIAELRSITSPKWNPNKTCWEVQSKVLDKVTAAATKHFKSVVQG